MADFSDDERFEVDAILQQRKRKGVLEYLVKWKNESTDTQTWEPAQNIKAECTAAIESFEKSLKAKRRSSSRSRSSKSRSRSRSSSRSRKSRVPTRKKTTQSEGKSSETPAADQKAETSTKAAGDSAPEEKTATPNSSEVEVKQQEATTEKKVEMSTAANSSNNSTRVLRSSTAAARNRDELEVQRVHNEQRPVREDDKSPRSAIWKVADYAVIVLFVISAFAALFLFIQKFVDLEDFKKQAFPNLTVLQGRLVYVKDRFTDLATAGMDRVSDLWLMLVEQIQGSPKKAAVPKQ